MIQGQFRYSILQVPQAVTSLKLRGHLRREFEALQAGAQGESDIILVRLFVPEKTLFGLGQKKVDSLLDSLLGKCPNIQRIELEALSRPLSEDEMREAAGEAQAQLEKLGSEIMANPYLVAPAAASTDQNAGTSRSTVTNGKNSAP
ncbi:MAG: hypothetical protein L6Q55_03935 [Azonexus sp.]|nr:hypothetical protein [Azonexus sp.]MCK6411558.1 hypothetical protein [Azonexus sp.]